ncbi:hypothetical protein ACN3VN_11305 [Xylella fastidiosa]|uniref:hypothetical protein n=1 Tax=Xylella fastidiosa TaxID=2371 RepID=UPI001F28F34D|nr:hypothetical protein [Xylella fastidiosa]
MRVLSQAEEVMLRSVCLYGVGSGVVTRVLVAVVSVLVYWVCGWPCIRYAVGWLVCSKGGQEVGRECLWGYRRFLFSQCLCMMVLLGKVVE